MWLPISIHLMYYSPLTIIFAICIILYLYNFVKSKLSRKVCLVDYACFKPLKSQQRTREEAINILYHLHPNFSKEASEFFVKGMMASGIGDSTYLPEALLRDSPNVSTDEERREAEAAIYAVVDELFAKTAVKAEDVGVLVVNCSAFTPVPSLASMVVNRYKLRDSVKSFSLSGMGCSASLTAIGLANHLLQVHKNTYAMIVSTEIITSKVYRGNELNKLATNCVFRVGGAAMLLSNKPSDTHTSKYQLLHSVRTNTARFDTSYRCVYEDDDEENIVGFTVSKDLLVEAKRGIKEHIMTLGYLMLPLSEQLLFLWNSLLGNKSYIPNFRSAIDHFFPHVGGRMVIDELQNNTKLDGEAARMTLYRYGNTSSSSTWYEIAYTEAKRNIKKGDRLWQIAFGSGFECSSVIWYAMKNNVDDQEKENPWIDEIERYPIKLEKFEASPLAFEEPK